MPLWKHYHIANSIEDALQALETAPGLARLVAGGTDLLLDLQQHRQAPVDLLVDVTRVPELTCLELRPNHLFIGAAVPLSRIASSSIIRQHAQALVEACNLIGGPQVRHVATLGGNVAHALPAADGTIALLALDAVAEVAGMTGRRHVALADLFMGPGKTALGNHELLVGFHLPLHSQGTASAFRRVMRPQGVALPVLNMAAWIKRSGEWMVGVRLAVGPAGPVPCRARQAEACLTGHKLDEEIIQQAVEALLSEVRLRTSPYRATSEYRRHLCGILLRDVLQAAYGYAEGETGAHK